MSSAIQSPCTSESPEFPGLTCNYVAGHYGSHYALGHKWESRQDDNYYLVIITPNVHPGRIAHDEDGIRVTGSLEEMRKLAPVVLAANPEASEIHINSRGLFFEKWESTPEHPFTPIRTKSGRGIVGSRCAVCLKIHA